MVSGDEETRHSRNLAVRPQLSIVIFDSTAPIGTGEGVYMDAVAEQIAEPAAVEVFSRRSVAPRRERVGARGHQPARRAAPLSRDGLRAMARP